MAANNLRVPLLSGVTAINTRGTPVRVQGMAHLKVYVIADGTISAGAVTIEEADINPAQEAAGYTGTWDAVGSAITPVTDSQVAAALTISAYSYIRAWISTGVTGGGTVDVILHATQ